MRHCVNTGNFNAERRKKTENFGELEALIRQIFHYFAPFGVKVTRVNAMAHRALTPLIRTGRSPTLDTRVFHF